MNDAADEHQRRLETWATDRVKAWGEPKADDYDFRTWANDAGKNPLKAGAIYEYTRESRKLRCLLALMNPKRSREAWEVMRPGSTQSERTGIENKWFALTGRVVELKVEEDGDLHIALHDATGDKPGVVVVEVPAQPRWCEIRTTVFSWTPTRFLFHTSSAKTLKFGESPIITVIGKAMWDVGHAPKEQNNRRKYMPDYAVWEIHPVMALHVVQ